jgi:formate dehydrogenase major subunit/formate dehydrogenase alpha subunit
MPKLNINGIAVEVPENTTVLRAAEKAGITIPTLCDHPDLTPFGGCRLCVVEVRGARFPAPSCTLLVSEGMQVQTETPALIQSRRAILEMLLSAYFEHDPKDHGGAETEFMYWVDKYGVDVKANMAPTPRYPVDSDPNPFIFVDMNKCILCTRCVRACAEVQGRFVWSQAERGYETHIVAGANSDLLTAHCESCGACVAYCPTGALGSRMMLGSSTPDRLVTTTCTYCGVGCQFDLNVKDDYVIGVTSNPTAPVNGMHLCVKGRFGYDFIHHEERLLKPRVRRYLLENQEKPHRDHFSVSAHQKQTANHLFDWVEVDWDTALDITAAKLAGARETYGPDSIGMLTSAKCLNEENYLMNKFARQVVGTNNIDHCARL